MIVILIDEGVKIHERICKMEPHGVCYNDGCVYRERRKKEQTGEEVHA
jgi:hypothetical protein